MEKEYLYISVTDRTKAIEILYFMSILSDIRYFAPWFYPDTSKKKIKKLYNTIGMYIFKERDLEVVTVYDGDRLGINKKARPILMTMKNIKRTIDKRFDDILESLAFYRENKSRWDFSYIIHENMIVVKSDLLSIIDDTEIRYYKTPPKNW